MPLGRPRRTRRPAVEVEGDAGPLQDLRSPWPPVLDGLTDADLDAASTLPWQTPPDDTVGHAIAWLNAELMKNVAEIGQLRLMRAASRS